MSHTGISKLITFTLINTSYCEQKSCINIVKKNNSVPRLPLWSIDIL